MFMVYSKDNCTFCEQAKQLLTSKGIPYQVKKLGEDISREELLELVPGARTMPQILRDGKVIGGFVELKQELLAA